MLKTPPKAARSGPKSRSPSETTLSDAVETVWKLALRVGSRVFGNAKRPKWCPFARSTDSWDLLMEPFRSFHTISLGSTLAIWVHYRAHRPEDPRMPMRHFSGRPRTPTRKKSLRPSKFTPPLLAARGGGVRGLPKGQPRRGARGPVEWPISEYCELACQDGAGRRRLELSLHFEPMADRHAPYPFTQMAKVEL